MSGEDPGQDIPHFVPRRPPIHPLCLFGGPAPGCIKDSGDHDRKSQAKGMLFCSTSGLPKTGVAQGGVPKLASTPFLGDVCGGNMQRLSEGAKNRAKSRDQQRRWCQVRCGPWVCCRSSPWICLSTYNWIFVSYCF